MSLSEPCQICHEAPAVRLLGTVAYCADCAYAFLEPIRRKLKARDELERKDLLHPPWLRTSEGHYRYDSLSDVDKQVWNRTRGQTREPHSLEVWAERLDQAVAEGLITYEEACKALSDHGY